jgi:ferritin
MCRNYFFLFRITRNLDFFHFLSRWQDGEEALRDALSMEKAVSKNINALIGVCENGDYFSADWLTGVWLEEQLGGQRHLAGLINSLSTFRRSHENLADWMFSNQLLKED